MLKLMKYEFIHSMRSFFISFCVFWGACLLLPFFTEGLILDIPILSFMMAFGFTVLVMGISIALFVSIFTHYYHSMFKRPAYLTLTLPVSSLQLIISKLIVSFVWLILGGIALMFGVLLMGVMMSLLTHNMSIMQIFQGIPEVFKRLGQMFMNQPGESLLSLIYMIVETYALIISIYFALTLAHTALCRHHRLAVGICIWIVLGIIFSWIQFVLSGMSIASFEWYGIPVTFMFIDLFFNVILTFVTVYILDYHIEIE